MRREELYVADLVDNARAVREYLDGVTLERWDSEVAWQPPVLEEQALVIIRAEFPDLAQTYESVTDADSAAGVESASGD